MEALLKEKLWLYIVENNPEVILRLQDSTSVLHYLDEMIAGIWPMVSQLIADGRPGYIVEELCMDSLTQGLRPSRYLYIRNLVEEEFEATYGLFREAGILTYETVNLISFCEGVFEAFGFSLENEDDAMLRAAIIGEISNYLD